MNKDTLDTMFTHLQNAFDVEDPNDGHEDRFLARLKSQEKIATNSSANYWRPFINIAAALIICFGLYTVSQNKVSYKELASVSPEMAETQSLFTTMINNELSKLNCEETPEYQELIVDALYEIRLLEEDYKQLKVGLGENPKEDIIITAMILNFQSRIDVLQDVLQKINEQKNSEQIINNKNII